MMEKNDGNQTREEQKAPAKAPPSKDTRFKTEDVTKRKGLSFEDFMLSKEL